MASSVLLLLFCFIFPCKKFVKNEEDYLLTLQERSRSKVHDVTQGVKTSTVLCWDGLLAPCARLEMALLIVYGIVSCILTCTGRSSCLQTVRLEHVDQGK